MVYCVNKFNKYVSVMARTTKEDILNLHFTCLPHVPMVESSCEADGWMDACALEKKI